MPKTPPLLLDWKAIQNRLAVIFPEGTPGRKIAVRDASAKTIFVMLYVNAIEYSDRWLRPNQVTRMTDEQATLTDLSEREDWFKISLKPEPKSGIPGRWYHVDTRESIRDEALRQGLVPLGAVLDRPGVPTTSSRGKYALVTNFAALFDAALGDEAFERLAASWRENNLTPEALAAITLRKGAVTVTDEGVLTRFPNGETRRLAPGPSSIIAKAVVEDFAPRFLNNPGVLWLSESARKEDRRDSELAKKLRLKMESDKNLPDIILVDQPGDGTILFVFVEVVASDGPITETRRQALLKLITDAGYKKRNAAFVTAYIARDEPTFRRTIEALAWQSFAWCLSEPDRIIGFHVRQTQTKLSDLLRAE